MFFKKGTMRFIISKKDLTNHILYMRQKHTQRDRCFLLTEASSNFIPYIKASHMKAFKTILGARYN